MAFKFNIFQVLGLGFLMAVSTDCANLINRKCTTPNGNNGCGNSSKSAVCANCLAVQWKDFQPYSYKNTDGEMKGLIPGLLEQFLNHCCASCQWKVNLTMSEKIVVNNDYDIFFPCFVRSDETLHHNMRFVPVIKDPAVVYITKRAGRSGIPKKLMKAIWNAWPVLIVALLLSLHAGVLLWLMEFWGNQEEFPASFTKGSWEGFWWAFVSMTTVGYGDRAPRSILGRGFAVCWILIGICICSIFTATLTTALTTITLEEVKTMKRAKVGAVKGSLESLLGVESQAKVVPFNTSDELWKAFDQNRVEGILMDSYHSATTVLSKKIQDEDLKISETVSAEDRWHYGMLVKDHGMAKCFNEAFENLYEGGVLGVLADEIESEETESETEASKRSSSVFDPTGDVFWPALYACIGFTLLIIAFGLIWEFVVMPKLQRKTKPNESSCAPPNMDLMEKEMISEVQRLFADWRTKLEEKATTPGSINIMEMS